jgi:site-specific DNA recombinase
VPPRLAERWGVAARAGRPLSRDVFTGLLRCGICGGGVVTWNRVRIGCAAPRNKGAAVCDNLRNVRRDRLEATVLDGLRHHLMDPALMEVFCGEYTRHTNRRAIERHAGRTATQAEPAKLARQKE